jgi:hypothetical protein
VRFSLTGFSPYVYLSVVRDKVTHGETAGASFKGDVLDEASPVSISMLVNGSSTVNKNNCLRP